MAWKARSRAGYDSSSVLGFHVLMHASILWALFATAAHICSHTELVVHQDPQVPFHRTAPQTDLSLFNFLRFLLVHYSCLSILAAGWLSLSKCLYFIRAQFIPSSRSLMKILNIEIIFFPPTGVLLVPQMICLANLQDTHSVLQV